MNYWTAFILTSVFLLFDILVTSFFSVMSDIEVCNFLNCSNHNGTRLFDDYTYDFSTSQLDFIFPVFFRFTILAAGLAGIMANRETGALATKSMTQTIFCLFLVLFMFSPVKLLALCEYYNELERLRYFWATYVSNHVLSVLGFLIWQLCFTKIDAIQNDDQTDDTETLVHENLRVQEVPENSTQKSAKEKEKLTLRESTSNLKRLGRYCLREWHWYSVGFTFLTMYSSGELYLHFIEVILIPGIICVFNMYIMCVM